jgi:hypothetical protein
MGMEEREKSALVRLRAFEALMNWGFQRHVIVFRVCHLIQPLLLIDGEEPIEWSDAFGSGDECAHFVWIFFARSGFHAA